MMMFQGQQSTALEAAANEAARRHERPEALALYRRAFDATDDGDARARIAERAAIVARHDRAAGAVLPMLHEALAGSMSPEQRGRLLFSESILLGYAGEHARRVASLRAARAALDEAGDDAALARVLGALSLPTDAEIPLPERIGIGRDGLRAARRAGDAAAEAHCAGNLANALMMRGDPAAFRHWRSAVDTLKEARDPALRDDGVRTMIQWIGGTLAFARYDDAARLIAAARDRTTNSSWLDRIASYEAVLLWRTGRWDEALAAAESVRPDPDNAVARLVREAIGIERRRVTTVEAATGGQWLPSEAVMLALAASLRRQMRQPNPHRGIAALAQTYTRLEATAGWEDLIVAAAEADPELGEQVRSDAEAVGMNGPRADAALASSRAFAAAARRTTDPGDARCAADEWQRLGEPMREASMLELAAEAIVRDGRGAGDLRRRAAEIYAAVGAERSLGRLIRRSGRSSALDRYRTPPSQRHAPSPGLTPREQQIAERAAKAYTAQQIADEFGISVATVRTHIARIKRVLGVERKSDLVRRFGREAG